MAYGSRRRTRSRRRPRRSFARTLRRRVKSRKTKVKRQVKRYAASLQSSSYVPKSRIVTISDDRTYHVHDNGYIPGLPSTRGPLLRKFNLNDPATFWDNTFQGEWTQTDFGIPPGGMNTKTSALPGLSNWITDHNADGHGAYRYGEVTSVKLIVSVYPVSHQPGALFSTGLPLAIEPVQAVSKMVMRKVTKKDDIPINQSPSISFNADSESRKPYTLSGNLYSAVGGAPKGCTQTLYYKFSNLNRGTARAGMNHFYLDQSPTEKDHAYLCILPTHTNWNSGAALDPPINMCGRFRIHIKALVTLKLSEPNTKIFAGEGSGAQNTRVQMFDSSGNPFIG